MELGVSPFKSRTSLKLSMMTTSMKCNVRDHLVLLSHNMERVRKVIIKFRYGSVRMHYFFKRNQGRTNIQIFTTSPDALF